MNGTEKNTNTTPLEEEFSKLGFDYKNMVNNALYLRDDFAIFIDTIKLNVSSEQQYHDEIHIEFGIDCTEKRKPSSIRNMSVKLMRYEATAYEGKELDYQYYHQGREFPSKDQIRENMKQVLQILEKKEKKRIIHARDIFTKVNNTEQGNPNTLRRKL